MSEIITKYIQPSHSVGEEQKAIACRVLLKCGKVTYQAAKLGSGHEWTKADLQIAQKLQKDSRGIPVT